MASSPASSNVDEQVALAVADSGTKGEPLDRHLRQESKSGRGPARPRRRRKPWAISRRACWPPARSTLADLNGDGIPDLIVANSGSNNVLVYPAWATASSVRP